jgi:hypothetical protein
MLKNDREGWFMSNKCFSGITFADFVSKGSVNYFSHSEFLQNSSKFVQTL